MSEEHFFIRSAREDDLEALLRLSELVYFINLPSDREILKEKILKSVASFNGMLEDKFEREYILVLENAEDHSLVGTSMIIARHGSPTVPHMFFELKEIHKYSETIHTGFIHKVLRLRYDHDGPTEIGALVLHPDYRGNAQKLGRQLSFARFLFIKMRRRWFKDRILSELMPPLTENGESILWEAVGRRFTNLSYTEADLLSRKNKEFVTTLFPKGDIYTCLLPGEVRDAIGKVGKETEPVKHMLERIGFQWKEHIDPFDGGPHYWAETDKISLISASKKYKVSRELLKRKTKDIALIGCFVNDEFRCVQASHEIYRGNLMIPKVALETLGIPAGDFVYSMPLAEKKAEKADPPPRRMVSAAS
ncbi:MAG: arginine N-succinyltransferase [Deltaproteobacteria bacterium]|nr:arginine N-succinyltransferase [Deltaproteobacteria bacterium]